MSFIHDSGEAVSSRTGMIETLEEARERLRPYGQRTASLKGVMFEAPSRPFGAETPWDYMKRARNLVPTAARVIDMGTGDGERYASICKDFPGYAVATEEWDTSASIAMSLFRRSCISLVRCRSHLLPFADTSFDLVLNRHEEFTPREVARVLRPSGIFLTEQWGTSWEEMRRFFPRIPSGNDLFQDYVRGLGEAGLIVSDARRAHTFRVYSDVGDIVTAVALDGNLIPDFDPLGVDLESILDMERELSTPEGLRLSEGLFIIESTKA
ncbi:MAG TPA: methyltransferase domain-containing protein [Dehalococcoidia bacterium]|nr:methyltransferase domain-containing protein [Dehalococcoidia bacterium]